MLDLAHARLELLDPLHERDHRVSVRIWQVLQSPRLSRRGIAPGDGSRRYPDRRGVRWHVFEHHRPRANPGALADGHGAEHRRADADDCLILDRWMPLAALLPGPAQRHPLVHRDVVADRGCLTNYDTHAVVDEDALSNPCSRMNLDPGDRPAHLGQETHGQ